MKTYKIKELAKLAGITVRTLHHYDEIELLKPSIRTDSDYRLYQEKDLLRLQQILLYKELELPLIEIKEILDNPKFNLKQALESHKKFLKEKSQRYKVLIKTIDKTIDRIKNKNDLVTDKELYEGFTKEQVEKYNKEVIEKWGQEKFDESQKNIRKLTKTEWQKIKEEQKQIPEILAKLIEKEPSDSEVQKIIELHKKNIENFYKVTKEVYIGLSNLYIEDSRFTKFYDKVKPGLAKFISKAMKIYAENNL